MSKITPCLWFDGQAEEAAAFYCGLFKNAKITDVSRQPDPAGGPPKALMVSFELDGRAFLGLNGGPMFKFNEAVSFSISCDGQSEVDHFWNGLLAGGGEESQCGWLKDRFGVSWQVVPKTLGTYLGSGKPAVMQAFMQMKKIDLAVLKAAAAG